MQIESVAVHPLRTEIDRPSWTAHERKTEASLTLVEVRAEDGTVGVGEIQSGPQATVCEYLERFAAVVTGMDPRATGEIWETLVSSTHPRPGGLGSWDGRPGPLPRTDRSQIMAAIGGIDIACWDLKGKAAGEPIFRLLGGAATRIDAYATGGYYVENREPADVADEFAEFVDDGFAAVKTKTGALSVADEAERIGAIRDAIGPDVELLLDLNGPYDVAGCLEFAAAVEPFDIGWLEEPLYWYLGPADFARLARDCPIPLAHGEREWHRFAIRDFIDAGGIRFVQFDATRRAGFTESLRIAHYAEQHGVAIAPHTAYHLHAHLVSAFGDAAYGVETHGRTDRNPIQPAIYADRAALEDGTVRLTDAPGFGIAVDWDAVESLRVAR